MKLESDMLLFFTMTLESEHFTGVKKKWLETLMLKTVVVIEKIKDIDKSEGLSGQILLLGKKAECTGLLHTLQFLH